MSSSERNDKARLYITSKLDEVEKYTEDTFKSIKNYDKTSSILTDLIEVKQMGFRGVVATALTGLYLNPDFDFLNDFYSCNPRSIFEQGIFYAYENRVPCGKSDPLNVAKNQYVLDETWAEGKRPQKAAQAAVNFLRILFNEGDEPTRKMLINFYFYRLSVYAQKVKAISIEVPNNGELSQQEVGHKLATFTLKYPESGTIPQYVVSLLLKALYADSSLTVEGGDESVFGTNTTSKKPADIWIEENGDPINLFEVTVKKVDKKRLDDCLQSLNAMKLTDRNINFICRMPDDISTLESAVNGTYLYKGKKFNFVDIYHFILSIIAMLKAEQINAIIEKLADFMQQVTRPISTKEGWNSIFANNE
jgi:hypothetical protein